MSITAPAATKHSAPPMWKASWYEPLDSRSAPAPYAAAAAPIWCDANTQPYTIPAFAATEREQFVRFARPGDTEDTGGVTPPIPDQHVFGLTW